MRGCSILRWKRSAWVSFGNRKVKRGRLTSSASPFPKETQAERFHRRMEHPRTRMKFPASYPAYPKNRRSRMIAATSDGTIFSQDESFPRIFARQSREKIER